MMEYRWTGRPPRNPYPTVYPRHLGYYMKVELNPEPYEVIKEVYQLDKALIRKINSKGGGYRFPGNVNVFDQEDDYDPILRNTVVLENYVNRVRPRENRKLRIFARGGPLCMFLAANAMRLPIASLGFDYNEEENILRFFGKAESNTGYQFTMMARHRLTGDKSETIQYGMNILYRVMEVSTEDYDLFYSKQIDGFDGDEPIEIRKAIHDGYLNGIKFCYKSAALAGVYKMAIVLDGEEEGTVDKVSINDDFCQLYARPEIPGQILFGRMTEFFQMFIPILKFFKSGTITRADGGTIIKSTFLEPRKSLRIIYNKMDVEDLEEDEKVMVRLKHPTALRDLYGLIEVLDRRRILACFMEVNVEQRINTTLLQYWKGIIEDINPDLARSLDVWVFSSHFPNPPHLPKSIVYNTGKEWSLTQANNFLVGSKREDIQRLLENLRKPLPELLGCICVRVYTQEPCEDLLCDYFGDLITFEQPEQDEPIIFCTPIYLPYNQDFRTALMAKLTNSCKSPFSVDLYLIGRQPTIRPGQKLDNKSDLEYLETFLERGGLDPVRKFPIKIALFSKDQEEISKVEEILKESHMPLVKGPNQFYTIFQARE